MWKRALAAVAMLAAAPAMAQTPAAPHWPNQQEADFVMRDFHFADGESLPELKMHYMTIGTPRRSAESMYSIPCAIAKATS